jgi:Reverse transcriptase (RNA-dependent DNA polymerase)
VSPRSPTCFDEIDYDALMAGIGRRVVDRQMLKLPRCWLRAGILEGGVIIEPGSGTPQGSPIPPLLASIALHRLDQAMQASERPTGKLVRYADDFAVVCPTADRAHEAQRRATTVLSELGLTLSPEKTRIVELTRGKEGFDFLLSPAKESLEVATEVLPAALALSASDEQNPGAHRPPVYRPRAEHRRGRLNPVLPGWATTSATATQPRTSRRSIPTSMNASRSLRPLGEPRLRTEGPPVGSTKASTVAPAFSPRGTCTRAQGTKDDRPGVSHNAVVAAANRAKEHSLARRGGGRTTLSGGPGSALLGERLKQRGEPLAGRID